jgi:SAM-dependent methyltransferase
MTQASPPTSGIEQARRYWDERATTCEDDCARVDQSRRAQRVRFEVFVLNHDLQGCSLLDVGCGTGEFFAHLQRRGIACAYTGLDLSPAMIRRARERFPGADFIEGNAVDALPGRQFDYTVCIGIHNVKVPGAWDILAASLRRQFELCTVAAHASLLNNRYAGFGEHVQAWRLEDVLALALSITPYIVLRNDYLPNDFSITLYRRPLIDTARGLLLD